MCFPLFMFHHKRRPEVSFAFNPLHISEIPTEGFLSLIRQKRTERINMHLPDKKTTRNVHKTRYKVLNNTSIRINIRQNIILNICTKNAKTSFIKMYYLV